MRTTKSRMVLVLGSALLFSTTARAAAGFNDALGKAATDYESRLRQAADDLNGARARIADEKAPMLEQLRLAQNRIIAAQSAIARLETGQASAKDERRKLLRQIDDLRKTTSFAVTLGHDSLEALCNGFGPGESGLWNERAQSMLQKLEGDAGGLPESSVAETVEFMLEHTRRRLGGYAAKGRALLSGTNRVVEGTFAFAGPETYFLRAEGGPAAVVRSREGGGNPVAYEIPDWQPAEAAAYFSGQSGGKIVADASGGKALRLKETRGTLFEHIHTGGIVGYAIVAVGLLALLMILQKTRDVSRLVLDERETVQAFLGTVASGVPGEAERALTTLKGTTRSLFAAGLRHRQEPKEILEEHLESLLLEQRLFSERRLPLLAVIATAAPLMGLLGTVTGMVKTFALITVSGTGNAAKLSSGISEVLVATELGLVVAIPTLVAHGFLAHRIHKRLSQLERYTLQFITAVETGKLRRETPTGRTVPA